MRTLTNPHPIAPMPNPRAQRQSKLVPHMLLGGVMGGMMSLCVLALQDVTYDVTAELRISEHVNSENRNRLAQQLALPVDTPKISVTLNQPRPWQWMTLAAKALFAPDDTSELPLPQLLLTSDSHINGEPLKLTLTSPHHYRLQRLDGFVLGKSTVGSPLKWDDTHHQGYITVKEMDAPVGTSFILSSSPKEHWQYDQKSTSPKQHITLHMRHAEPLQARALLDKVMYSAINSLLNQQHKILADKWRTLRDKSYDLQIKQELAQWQLMEYRREHSQLLPSPTASQLLHELLRLEEQRTLQSGDKVNAQTVELELSIALAEAQLSNLPAQEQELIARIREAESISRLHYYYQEQATAAQNELLAANQRVQVSQQPLISTQTPLQRWITPLILGTLLGGLLGVFLLKRPI